MSIETNVRIANYVEFLNTKGVPSVDPDEDVPSNDEFITNTLDVAGMVAARCEPRGEFLAPNLTLRDVNLVMLGMGFDALVIDQIASRVTWLLRNRRFNKGDWL